MKDIYLTSTFTNPWNVDFNPKIGKALEDKGFVCYLPYRDTDGKTDPSHFFEFDTKAILDSKCIVAVALNESANWGAEVAFAYTSGKPVIALTNKDHQIPLICDGMIAERIRVENLDDIESYVSLLSEVVKKYL